jgi:hypothetical protein
MYSSAITGAMRRADLARAPKNLPSEYPDIYLLFSIHGQENIS